MTRICLSLFLLLSLPGLWAQKKLQIVATASMMADMTRAIAGPYARVTSIVPVGSDPHLYDPTPADAKMVADADLVLMNGLHFEGWLSDLIEQSGTRAQISILTEGITPISNPLHPNSFDPHAWMTAVNGRVYCQNILLALLKADPLHSDFYRQSHARYDARLDSLDQYIRKEIAKIPEDRRVLITSHDAFHYYGNQYGLKLFSILGTSTESEAQTSDIIRLTKIIQETSVPAVFIESTINPKLIEQLARETGVRIGGKLFSDSLSDPTGEAPDYLAMLGHNTDTIVKGLMSNASEGQSAPSGRTSNYLLAGLVLGLALTFIFLVRKSRAHA